MAETAYNVMKGKDLSSGTVRCLLLKTTAAGAFDPDIATITALLAVATVEECDFTNYVRKTVTVTRTVDNSNNRVNFDVDDIVWDTAGGVSNNTPVALVFYLFDTDDSSSLPISYHDSNFSTATNGADYTVAVADFCRDT